MTLNANSWTVRHWWIPFISIAVLVAPVIYIGAVLQRQETERQMAPLRERAARLDEHCSYVRLRLWSILLDDYHDDYDLNVRSWLDLSNDDARDLRLCLADGDADTIRLDICPNSMPNDVTCVRAKALFAWAHLKYGAFAGDLYRPITGSEVKVSP